MTPQPDSALLGCFAQLLLPRFGFRDNLLVQLDIPQVSIPVRLSGLLQDGKVMAVQMDLRKG